jgi:hypothetical protein
VCVFSAPVGKQKNTHTVYVPHILGHLCGIFGPGFCGGTPAGAGNTGSVIVISGWKISHPHIILDVHHLEILFILPVFIVSICQSLRGTHLGEMIA